MNGRKRVKKRAYRRRDGERGPFRVPERDSFRHELADHDVQVGDDQQGEDDGEERRHDAVELVGEHLLAERADGEARDRHAELHRRDEPRRVAGDPTHRSRALVPLVLELQDAGPARRDEAVFSRDEERVHQDEAGERQHLEGERHRERPEDARVLGGRSSSTRISRRSIAGRATERTYVLSCRVRIEYREEPCKVALNHVKGMPFDWSLNPYMGCVHQLHLLLRALVRAARRPAVRPPLRHIDPREGECCRAACASSSPGRAGVASRS